MLVQCLIYIWNKHKLHASMSNSIMSLRRNNYESRVLVFCYGWIMACLCTPFRTTSLAFGHHSTSPCLVTSPIHLINTGSSLKNLKIIQPIKDQTGLKTGTTSFMQRYDNSNSPHIRMLQALAHKVKHAVAVTNFISSDQIAKMNLVIQHP